MMLTTNCTIVQTRLIRLLICGPCQGDVVGSESFNIWSVSNVKPCYQNVKLHDMLLIF